MKKNILGAIILLAIAFQSCDKVKNPYPKQYVDIDTTLLYGMNLETYKNTLWPTFGPNTNTNVNVLIEDFTGHKCVNCPNAALEARNIEGQHDGRVFVASIHSGPSASTYFQSYQFAPFTTNFTTPDGLAISTELTDGGFIGNPSGTNNRKTFGGFIFQNYSSWASNVSSILTSNVLKVNLQSSTNYFPETRGVFLHTEVDKISTDSLELYQVVYLIEDSIIKPQILPDNTTNLNYVHRDVHRGNIDGKPMGRKITEDMKVDKNGAIVVGDKYYLNYSYRLPDQYNPDNMHLLIYVYRNDTKEILQVIKQKIKP